MNDNTVRVTYLELTRSPSPIRERLGDERIGRESLPMSEYLDLYGRVGKSLRWDQRLRMPRSELTRLLESESSQIYVLRDDSDGALGFCEFERHLPDIELRNFGIVAAAQGRGLGTWLLRTALYQEWSVQPNRIWLHTDSWDHPAAIRLYQDAGFQICMVREEPPGDL
ncbi:MAG: GNAT family N-acetyltransferase [Steroidobacteraceae bacterium]